MSGLRNKINPIFLTGKTNAVFDEDKGHVRLPIDDAEVNEPWDEADRIIKEKFGDEHFYGEIGMPILLVDRMAAGVC